MANKNFLVNLDLNKNEIKNAVLHKNAGELASVVEAQVYYNSTTKEFVGYDGTNHIGLGGDIREITDAGNDRIVVSGTSGTVTLDVDPSELMNDSATGTGDLLSASKIISLIAAETTARGTAVSSEASTRASADNALDARLDVVEGDSSTTGSIAKAQADASASAVSTIKGAVSGSYDTLKKVEDKFGSLDTLLASDDTSLDTLQEVVTFVKDHETELTAFSASKYDTAGTGLEESGTTVGIANSGVDTAQLADSAVETAKINDGAVTNAKLNASDYAYSSAITLTATGATATITASTHGQGSSPSVQIQRIVAPGIYGDVESVTSYNASGDVTWSTGLNSGSTTGRIIIKRF